MVTPPCAIQFAKAFADSIQVEGNLVRVLVTGNLGYIGTILTHRLRGHGFSVQGLDIGYFADCVVGERPKDPPTFRMDIRDVTGRELRNVEAVVHLAGLSNDPLGEFDPSLTAVVNLDATCRLIDVAKEAGVRRFVYASSQSMYGVADTAHELDEYSSEKAPVTAYARTKWEAEEYLSAQASDRFTPVSFRPSTVFGWSPRQRLDIVFPNLVATALTQGAVRVLSDGTPWRPVVHVDDVCLAFELGLTAPPSLISGRAFNVGYEHGNFTVRDLAEAAVAAVPGSTVDFSKTPTLDNRTYRVSFRRIFEELDGLYSPSWNLASGAEQMVSQWSQAGLTSSDITGPRCVRLNRLKELLAEGRLDDDLRLREVG